MKELELAIEKLNLNDYTKDFVADCISYQKFDSVSDLITYLKNNINDIIYDFSDIIKDLYINKQFIECLEIEQIIKNDISKIIDYLESL